MSEIIYRLYGLIHYLSKRILGKQSISASPSLWRSLSSRCSKIGYQELSNLWYSFIVNSEILSIPEYAGFHYAGYIKENQRWCLASWIWTNAALVRMYCNIGEIDKAEQICQLFIGRQEKNGGWIVRNDYDERGPIPMLAPNDSAYIANNAFISLYLHTQDYKYLEVAKKCADWIMKVVRPDGIVYTGYNMRDKEWIQKNVIVDIGFTAGLFAKMYEITHEEKYKSFLSKFIDRYIQLFYSSSYCGFCTSIDENNKPQGGMFARGQAWALEGLIPAYIVLKEQKIRTVIETVIDKLITSQTKHGSWSYNLTRKLMGEDCKAVSVIAKNLMEWYQITSDQRIRDSAYKALCWCYNHTMTEGESKGGIFSFCVEGAIVHNLYTSCAFVYASAYAIELKQMLCDE